MTRLRLALLLAVLVGSGLVPARAEDEPKNPVAAALGHEIISSGQTMSEVQNFTEDRIPPMPEVKTADEWTDMAQRLRQNVHERVIFRGEADRWRNAGTRVVWQETIEGGPGYRIKKLRYEALPGVWIPALLYEPTDLHGKVPVVLNVNGHDSKGKAADYKQIRCINQAKRGMIALNVEWFGMGQLATPGFSHGLINAIDLCGTGGIATHYLYLQKGLDILLAHENADPNRVGVTGLSGGGWQTIFISPLDTRVTFTDPVAGYSSFRTRARYLSDLGDSEQTPCDLATVVDYTHLTAMMAPRPTLLTFNARDNCCFAAGHALPPLLDAARPVFTLFGEPQNLRWHINDDPGTHNYQSDNRQALYSMMEDHWSDAHVRFEKPEIPSESEVKSAEELAVELPEDNTDIHDLAMALSAPCPAMPRCPRARRPPDRGSVGSGTNFERSCIRLRGRSGPRRSVRRNGTA